MEDSLQSTKSEQYEFLARLISKDHLTGFQCGIYYFIITDDKFIEDIKHFVYWYTIVVPNKAAISENIMSGIYPILICAKSKSYAWKKLYKRFVKTKPSNI